MISVTYAESGHARRLQPRGYRSRKKPCRPILTIDPHIPSSSDGSSSSSSSGSASTAPTSAASTSSWHKTVSPFTHQAVPVSKTEAADVNEQSDLSEEDKRYARLVAAIRSQALSQGTPLETILHNVIISIYNNVFNRGPCPPVISGVAGPPIACNDPPASHAKAAQAFAHMIWSTSDPYAIKHGQCRLTQQEVFVLRFIILVRCCAGWYKLDVQAGIVEEGFEGKGKGKSIWL